MTLESFLPPGFGIEDLLILSSALSAGSIAITVWVTLLHRDPGARRIKMIAAHRQALRAGVVGPRRRHERLPTISLMRRVVDRLHLLRSAQASKISIKLMRAGWRSKDAIIRYLFFKVALPFVFGGLAVFLFYGLDAYKLAPTSKLAITIFSVLFGAYAPDIFIRNAAQKRQDQIRKALPDALDLMVICAEAGLSLDATLMRVSHEMETAAPELADELSLTGLELGFLPDRRKALQNLALRVDLVGVRGVVNTLLQAERYGTPLAQSLRVMAAESRNERIMKAEEKAARLPALLTVPMVAFILPPLFIVLLGRAILNTYDAFSNLF
ncbi:MAG: type II secretion system F family protein [Kiloniellaceae bacterium]